MVINVNWTTTAAAMSGLVGGLGYTLFNKNKTAREKTGTLVGITVGTAVSAISQELSSSMILATAEEYVSSLTDEQLAQACELLDGEKELSVEKITQHLNNSSTKDTIKEQKTNSL